MISNTHLEAGCVFDSEVQYASGDLGFATHLEIALSHSSKRGLDVGLDPDGFVLLEQLRFADLVAKSIYMSDCHGLSVDERDDLLDINLQFYTLVLQLLDKGVPQSVEEKRGALVALKRFDQFTVRRAELVATHFEHVQKALDLAEQYRLRGILGRLYRLMRDHPIPRVKGIIGQLLLMYVKPALNYVGPGYGEKSPEVLSGIMAANPMDEEGSTVRMPSSLNPEVLDAWIRSYERDLL